jgi:hypothetical protein
MIILCSNASEGCNLLRLLTLADRVRRNELELVAKAYRRIRLDSLATKLGLDVQETATGRRSCSLTC